MDYKLLKLNSGADVICRGMNSVSIKGEECYLLDNPLLIGIRTNMMGGQLIVLNKFFNFSDKAEVVIPSSKVMTITEPFQEIIDYYEAMLPYIKEVVIKNIKADLTAGVKDLEVSNNLSREDQDKIVMEFMKNYPNSNTVN